MDIKEIVLQLAHRKCTRYNHVPVDRGIRYNFSDAHLIDLAEALIAEIAKQNEPVAYRWKEKGRWLSWYVDWTWHDKAKSLGFPVEYAYTYPPTAEQIANETAEAIARMLENGSFLTPESRVALAANGAAKAIRRGAWKEFKK